MISICHVYSRSPASCFTKLKDILEHVSYKVKPIASHGATGASLVGATWDLGCEVSLAGPPMSSDEPSVFQCHTTLKF